MENSKTVTYTREQISKRGWRKVPKPAECWWEFDEFSGAYFFTCNGENRAFTFMNSLKEDGFKFCPYCGKKLVVK